MDHDHPAACRGPTFVARVVALSSVVLLGGCGMMGPSWVDAPLIADSSRSTSGEYRAFGEELALGEDDRLELKFSLATLPSGSTGRIVVSNGTATVDTTNYALTPAKVFRARLVLLVEQVIEPGIIRIEGAYTTGTDCYASEASPANCAQGVANGFDSSNADQPGQLLRIETPGYYAFDVTDAIRHRIANGYAGILRVTTVPDPQTSAHGRFIIASKERVTGERDAPPHEAQLFITLTDAVAISHPARTTTSVQRSLTDPTLADRNFSNDADMLVNGDPDEIAYALVQPAGPTAGNSMRQLLDNIGTTSYRVTLQTYVNTAIPEPPGIIPATTWYRIDNFSTHSSDPITWNNGWTEPTAAATVFTQTLATGVPNQVRVDHITLPYLDAAKQAYDADSATVNFALAARSNVAGPVTLDGWRNMATGRSPQLQFVLSPKPTQGTFFNFDANDTTFPYTICIKLVSTCEASPSIRTRIGQRPEQFFFNVDPRVAGSLLRTAINVTAPRVGPSIAVTSPSPIDQSSTATPYIGYVVALGDANRVVGAYSVWVSLPGHNTRRAVQFENLPLPVPTLTGPASVVLPTGATSITVPIDAPVPFVLGVDDAVVNALIDDTTTWHFTSSDPADTMPANLVQGDGIAALAMTFGGVGTRTITVRSVGDEAVFATLQVTVSPPADALFSHGFEGG